MAIKVLTMSGWNPPPGNRKLQGDLMYLFVVTLEEKRFHITASSRGFYVNQSTEEEFNPKAGSPRLIYHSLIDLLGQISPLFKRTFAAILKKRQQRHPFERVATPYQVYSWTSPHFEHTIDAIRAEDAFSSKLGYEEHIPGQTRDWNEELQTTRELSRKTLPERLLRERAIFKVHGDFVAAATRGAIAVIDGNVMAINPGEETKMQMFIWNNIFFSLGFDVRDHYKDLGGDAAAFVAPSNDLQGVKAYCAVDVEGLYTLGTVVVDYRGYRVTAQSIIPGILEREQEQSVVYGSVDFGKTVVTHPKYLELLGKAAQALKILPHKVLNEKGDEVEICSSVECKGIIGNDSRHYILDLLRTFPPDVNFLQIEIQDDSDLLSQEVRDAGFPRSHRHKLCCLRQELVDAFFEARYMTFIKLAAHHLQQLGQQRSLAKAATTAATAGQLKEPALTNGNSDHESAASDCKVINHHQHEGDRGAADCASTSPAASDSAVLPNGHGASDSCEASVKRDTAADDFPARSDVDNTKDIVKKAAVAVGSLKETEFDIRFNPDIHSEGVKHADCEDLRKQKQLIRDAAEFVLHVQIPGFVRDCLDNSVAPYDGATLSEALHSRGINIRYLGVVTDLVKKAGRQLEYLHSILVTELMTRAAKHLFNNYIQGLEMTLNAAAISHFLNCFLSSCHSLASPSSSDDGLVLRSRNNNNNSKRNKVRGRGSRHNGFSQESNDWALLTTRSLWSNLRNELLSYYHWNLFPDNIDDAVHKCSLQKISILRSFCMKTGIQLLLKEYAMDNKSKSAFSEEDIVNVFPVVKHIHPRATDAYNFYTTGQTKIQQGYLKDGYEMISEALNLLNNVYGAMHPEIAQCLRMLARLNYIMGDHAEATSFQQKAVLMSEKVNGIDHPYTITEYVCSFFRVLIFQYTHTIFPSSLSERIRPTALTAGSSGLVLFREFSSDGRPEAAVPCTLPADPGVWRTSPRNGRLGRELGKMITLLALDTTNSPLP